MAWKVRLAAEVKTDLKELDGSVKQRAKKALEKISNSPQLGKKLGKKQNMDLTSCRAIYFFKKQYRIVYEIFKVENKVVIYSVGRRENMAVYKQAFNRKAFNNS